MIEGGLAGGVVAGGMAAGSLTVAGVAMDGVFALAALVAFAAGFVRGFSGFGLALVASPPMAILYGPAEAVVLVLSLDFCAALQLLPGAVRRARWREMAPMGLAAWVGLPLGAWILLSVEAEIMQRVIAATVCLCGLVLLAGWRYAGRPRMWMTLATGASSGVLTGAVGAGGPPVIFYLLSGPDSAATSRDNIIAYFLLLDIAAVTLLFAMGAGDGRTLLLMALLVPPMVIGVWLGGRLFRHTPDRLFRRLALACITGAALVSLVV